MMERRKNIEMSEKEIEDEINSAIKNYKCREIMDVIEFTERVEKEINKENKKQN